MTFAIGLMVGLAVGGSLGTLAIAMVTAGKISDLQDKVDAHEVARSLR